MDYKEKLLNVKQNSSNQNKNNIDNSQLGYHDVDAFHHANFFSKLLFCWVNKIFKVNKN